MANRNLADEVDALAKGLASLRVANKRTVSRVAALEDRELKAFSVTTKPLPPVHLHSHEEMERRIRPSLWQRIRAWWAR